MLQTRAHVKKFCIEWLNSCPPPSPMLLGLTSRLQTRDGPAVYQPVIKLNLGYPVLCTVCPRRIVWMRMIFDHQLHVQDILQQFSRVRYIDKNTTVGFPTEIFLNFVYNSYIHIYNINVYIYIYDIYVYIYTIYDIYIYMYVCISLKIPFLVFLNSFFSLENKDKLLQD